MPADDPVRIGVAIVRRGDAVLIGCRPEGVPLAGLWEFPGGKARPGETEAAAADRECLEETSVRIRILKERKVVQQRYDYGLLRIRFFDAVPVDAGEAPALPFRWVEIQQLDQYPFPEANLSVLAELKAEASQSE